MSNPPAKGIEKTNAKKGAVEKRGLRGDRRRYPQLQMEQKKNMTPGSSVGGQIGPDEKKKKRKDGKNKSGEKKSGVRPAFRI